MRIKKKTPQYESEHKLIHYVYRSFNDLFLKCSMSNYGDYQSRNNATMNTDLDDIKNLPHKFKMAAIYQRISSASQGLYPILYRINLELEEKLIHNSAHFGKITNLHFAFQHYSNRIDLIQFTVQMKAHKNYRKYGRIPHHILSEISDNTLMPPLKPEGWIQSPRKKRGLFF